jgi:membrane glycosyltransferase
LRSRFPGRVGLLTTPEESSPPPIVQRANELTLDLARNGHDGEDGLIALHRDAAFREQHDLLLPAAARHKRGEFETDTALAAAKLNDAKNLEEILQWLTPKERMAVVNDRALISLLARLPAAEEPKAEAESASAEATMFDRKAG